MSKLERDFQRNLIKELEARFPGSVVLKNDPSYVQGIPDLIILHNDKWAMLEVKRSETATRRPNQEYYVNKLNDMSYSAFIHPGNKEVIFDELQRAFGVSRDTLVPERQ